MIVKNHEADRYVAAAPKDLRMALLFGPDAGLVQERAERLLKTVVSDINDAFNVAELSEETLLDDPARLADEAAAISMFGGRRVIRVRGAGNDLAELFDSFLDDPKGDSLIVVEAGDLARTSALRKLFEAHDSAVAIPCYADSERDLYEVVRDGLRAQGLTITADALNEAVSRLGSDRGVTRRELEKLILYAQNAEQVTIEDVRAVIGDESQARIERACDAAASGDFAGLDMELERLWASDTNPAQLIRAALSHFQGLLGVRERLARGEKLETAMRQLRPPVHFSRTSLFKEQLQAWSQEQLGAALDMLWEAESLSRMTAVPAQAACARCLMNIAAMAKSKIPHRQAL